MVGYELVLFYKVDNCTFRKVHFFGEQANRMRYSKQGLHCHSSSPPSYSSLASHQPAVKKAIVRWSMTFSTRIPWKNMRFMIAMMITMTTPSPICQHEAQRWCWRSSSPPRNTRPTLPKNHFWIKILLQLMQTYPHDKGTWYRGENKDCGRDEHKEQRSEGINLIR